MFKSWTVKFEKVHRNLSNKYLYLVRIIGSSKRNCYPWLSLKSHENDNSPDNILFHMLCNMELAPNHKATFWLASRFGWTALNINFMIFKVKYNEAKSQIYKITILSKSISDWVEKLMLFSAALFSSVFSETSWTQNFWYHTEVSSKLVGKNLQWGRGQNY